MQMNANELYYVRLVREKGVCWDHAAFGFIWIVSISMKMQTFIL